MSLRARILLAIGAIAVVFAGVLAVVASSVVLKSFKQLEEQDVARNVQRVQSMFNEGTGKLDVFAGDWAPWDDAYRFIDDKNQAFIESNFIVSTYTNANVNFMLFINALGQPVYGVYCDLEREEIDSMPPHIWAGVLSVKDLVTHDSATDRSSGLLMLSGTPALVAASPILTSDRGGPIKGSLIVGRLLDSTEIARYQERSNLSFTVMQAEGASTLENYRDVLSELLNGAGHVTRAPDADTLAGYTLIRDINGNPGLVLSISMPRDIYQRGKSTVVYAISALLVITLLFGLIIIMLMEHGVFRRITWLSNNLEKIAKDGNRSVRLPDTRRDEFGRLAADINKTLASLENSQNELKKSDERYTVLFSEMLNGFALHEIICNDKGEPVDYRYLDVNPAFERLTGMKRANVIGKRVRELMPDIEEIWIKRYGDVALHAKTLYFEEYNASLGKYFEVMTFSPQKGQFAVTFTDITARKTAESEKEKIHGQLLHAQKMEAIGTLAGGVAHDFNNLLCAIQGYADLLLQDKTVSEGALKGLKVIDDAAHRGTDLVRQLLTFSRKVETRMRPLNLNSEAQQVHNLLEHAIPKMIEMKLDLAPAIDTVNADATQVEQVLMNLVVNARDALPKGGTIVVKTENAVIDERFAREHMGAVAGKYVRVSVRDNGTGIPKDVLKHIFEPFFTTKDLGKGTGLGLASAYGIIKDHHGYICCESEPGKGTVFHTYWPVIEMADTSAVQSDPKDIPGGTETILLVDDEDFVSSYGRQVLEKAGYMVFTASNGEDALLLYKENRDEIAVVILDLIMPGMGGKECMARLLKDDPNVKVIVASGYSASGPQKDAMEGGAKRFVGKPYSQAQMLRAVRDVIDNK